MSEDDEIGYGKPPKKHRFKKGQSGNPRGRPKGSRNLLTDVREVLNLRVSVRKDGAATKMSTQRAVLHRLGEKALKGDQRAIEKVIDLAGHVMERDEMRNHEHDLTQNDHDILARFLERQEGKSDDT